MHNAALTDRGLPRSRVLEIDPRSQKVVWVYTHEEDFAGSTPPQFKFVSPYLSGAQRLPNGNTLICDGGSGRVFEVTPDGKTVWQLVNPEKRPLFRAYRYGSDFAGFAGRLP
jgi:hypothetical protein